MSTETTAFAIGAAAATLAAGVCANPCRAQCDDAGWQGGLGAPGVGSNLGLPQVRALQVWDPDGPEGPLTSVLVVGGWFTTAGGVAASNITVWDWETRSFRGTLSG